MSKPEKVKQAKELRSLGIAVKEIAKTLEVSQGSVSLWCRGIQLTEKQKEILARKAAYSQAVGLRKAAETHSSIRRELKKGWEKDGREFIGDLTDRDLLIFGIGLYAGEGFKSEDYAVGLANMDPNFLSVFLRWLDLLGVPANKVKAYLYIAPGYDIMKEIEWWCSSLGLKKTQFGKTIIKVSVSSKRKTFRLNYHGVLSLKIHNVMLKKKIQGMLKAFGPVD